MRIAQLASNEECVPPKGYGGTELIVSLLTEELVHRGHDVTLFATGCSQTAAKLVSEIEQPLRTTGEPARRWAAFDIRQLLQLRRRAGQFDIVHNHMGWQALPYLEDLDCAVVSTNHNPIKSYDRPIYMQYKDLPYVSISDSYRKLNLPDDLNYTATVYNGIDVSRFPLRPKAERSYLVFLGRLSKDKGTEEAIEIARRLDLPLVIAGKVDAADQDYFDQHVKDRLNNTTVRFIGEVGLHQKAELLSRAIATVYPINFEEPFGLVMAESLAAGTPVMAFDRGSVKEVLSDGVTAIVGTTIDELVNRFPEIARIEPHICRMRVESLFSHKRMVDGYESLYERLIGGRLERSA